MSKEYNSALQQELEQYLKAQGISQAEAAPLIGVSQATLSQYRRSMYENGNVQAIEAKLAEFLRNQSAVADHTERAQPYRPTQGYVPISTSEDIYQLIRYCQLEKGMVIVHGDAGIGKTKAASKFARENPNSTLYIEASPATGSLRELLRALARELKLPDKMKNGDLATAVKAKLKETRKTILLDEAQHLTYKALEEISRWGDPDPLTDERTIAIVLMGNTEIYTRMCGRQEAIFAQQFSRVKLNRLYRTTGTTRHDVELLFPLLEESGAGQELDFLHGISRSKWGVRGAVNVYNNAVNNENITYDGLYGVARSMGIGVI